MRLELVAFGVESDVLEPDGRLEPEALAPLLEGDDEPWLLDT